MKKAIARLLSASVLCALLAVNASAATLNSGHAAYQLSLDPLGTEPFSYSSTEIYSATLVPVGTQITSDAGGQLLVEIFTYQPELGLWTLDSLLSGQSQLVVRDGGQLYHIATLTAETGEDTLDRGIWVKAPSQGSCQPVSVTGERVDEWALNLVNRAIGSGLIPPCLQGQDLRSPITRQEFAALTVQLYEAVSGQPAALPEANPFTDTSDPDVLKAYAMGFSAGVSASAFHPDALLTREQAAVMLSAVCRTLGIPDSGGASSFSDAASIAPWARDSAAFAVQSGIIAGYGDGRFGPQDAAQRQACLIMALRIQQMAL